MDDTNTTKITDIKELQSQAITTTQQIIVAKDLKKNPNVLIPKKNIDLVKDKCNKSKYGWISDLLLALSTTFLGAIISFSLSGVNFDDWPSARGS